jgi:hypothetical protein
MGLTNFAILLFFLLLNLLPVLILVWAIRAFMNMRRDQKRMLQLVTSLEAEITRRNSVGQ